MLCPQCSLPIAEVSRVCPHCGHIAAVCFERTRSTLQCPRCDVDTELVSLGPVDVDHCSECGNVWFDNSELERAADAADGTSGSDFRDAIRCLTPVRSHPVGPAVVACPFCSNPLIRRQHPTLPAVVAQACALHGAWLERRHLLGLINNIEKHTLSGLLSKQKHNAEQHAEHLRSADEHLQQLAVRALRRLHSWLGW